jgi:hypothetical protein
MTLGSGVALCGPVLLAFDSIGRQDGAVTRVYNVMRWLGIGLPAPDNLFLIRPTLAFLNAPVWIVLLVLGLVVVAVFRIAHAARG